jgi:hypothetical protein
MVGSELLSTSSSCEGSCPIFRSELKGSVNEVVALRPKVTMRAPRLPRISRLPSMGAFRYAVRRPAVSPWIVRDGYGENIAMCREFPARSTGMAKQASSGESGTPTVLARPPSLQPTQVLTDYRSRCVRQATHCRGRSSHGLSHPIVAVNVSRTARTERQR